MHHVCNHAIGAAGFTGGPTPASLLSGFGALGTLGMLFAGLLGAALLLLWATQRKRPARAGFGAFADDERSWQGEASSEPGSHVSYARYDQPPQQYEARYEQPQAHYPEMPLDGPRTSEPGMYD